MHRSSSAVVLFALAVALPSCRPSLAPTSAPFHTPPPSPTHAPSTPSPVPPTATPTPTIQEILGAGVESALGIQAYSAEDLRTRARTPAQEAELLAAVPEEGRAAFLQRYLEAGLVIGNAETMRELAQSPTQCDSHSYLIIDPAYLSLSAWYDVWGPLNLDAILRDGGLPSSSERTYVVIDCDNPAEGLPQIDALRAESEARLVAEEELAEAILSSQLRDLIRRTFGEGVPAQVELQSEYVLQVTSYNRDTGEVMDSHYYPFQMLDDDSLRGARHKIYQVAEAHPPYDFGLRGIPAAMIDPDPAVPLVARAGGLLNFAEIGNAAVHQLMAPHPIGVAAGQDGRTITETVGMIAGNELLKEFLVSTYPYLARQIYANVFEYLFDSSGRHIHLPEPLSDDPGDPNVVYGANELGHAVFELRNCGIVRGSTLGEFLELVERISAANELYAALADCLAIPEP